MEKSSDSGRFFPQLIKGILTGVIATIAGILIFAVIVNLTGINQSVIKGVNQFIKIISVFIGCLFSFSGEKGLIKGAISGIIITVITYLIFLLFGHLICGSCVQYRFHLFKTFHWKNAFFLGAAIAFFPCLLYLLIRFFFMEVLSCLHVEPLTICTASTVAQLLPSAYRYCTFSIQLLFVHMKYALISTTLWSAAFLSGLHIVRYLQKNDPA